MLKIRRPLGRLIFNMGIAIPGKTVFLIETAPWIPHAYLSSARCLPLEIFVNPCNLTLIKFHIGSDWLFWKYVAVYHWCHLIISLNHLTFRIDSNLLNHVSKERAFGTYTHQHYIHYQHNWLLSLLRVDKTIGSAQRYISCYVWMNWDTCGTSTQLRSTSIEVAPFTNMD